MRRNKQNWYENLRLRLPFEAAARRAYPNLRCRLQGNRDTARVIYSLDVDVPEYGRRHIELHFRRARTEPDRVRMYADGPDESPHRFTPHPKDPYQRSSLCVWYEDDPSDQRWVPDDGLLALINHVRIHLFKEEHWRRTGHWPGPEAPHAAPRGGKR
jgi:hypothetical protein